MPATKPFVMVGRSASSRSSVSAASVALEHTSVEPASRVASRPNANPPIQKNGELQNSLSSAVSPRISLRFALVSEQRRVGVHHALGCAGRTRRVDDRQRIASRRRRLPAPPAAPRRPVLRGSDRSATWRSSGMTASVDRRPAASRVVVCRGSDAVASRISTSLWTSWSRSSGAVANVENGTTTAPIRAAASIATTKSGAVRVQQPDVGALAGAESDQAARQLRRPAVGLGVAEAVGVADQQRVIAPRSLPAVAVRRRRCTALTAAKRTGRSDRACRTASGGSRRRSRSRWESRSAPAGLAGTRAARRRRRTGLAQLDHRDGHLAEALVGSADHGRAPHGGMALQRGAHVVGQHLEAAADDRLVGAAEDPQEAVGVDAGQVGGAHPVRAPVPAARLHLEQARLVRRRAGCRRRRRRAAARRGWPGRRCRAWPASTSGGRPGSSRRRRRRTRLRRRRSAPGCRTSR